MGIGEIHIEFRWGNLREGENLEDLGMFERKILKCVFKK
jgi:hypothetical protein